MKSICRECGGNCKPSKGIVNYHNIQTQDLSKEFETKIEDCLKCENCGHSFISKKVDLFEHYETLPDNVKSIINFYENELKVMEEKIKEISEKASQKIKQVVSAEKEVREKKDKAIFLLNDVTIELEDKNKKVKKLTKELSTQMNLIKKLMISISEIEESIEK